jgi:AraC family transcriptional regulator, activator of mtrCDE
MYIEPNPSLTAGTPPRIAAPALEALLARSALEVSVVAELHKCGTWYADAPPYDGGLFHLVSAGHCQVESDAIGAPVTLETGDLVLFPHGASHRLSGSHLPGHQASLICGEFRFTGRAKHPLNLALPGSMVIRAAQATPSFRQIGAAMAGLVQADCEGRHVVLNKLADALFTLALCEYSNTADPKQGLFASLTDARVARVLQAIHERPGHAWTMQSMAKLACMSRSSFAERFTQLVQVPPIQYTTQWRVYLAEQWLQDRGRSVADVAQQLGYTSEAAFRRLFKRVSGVSPGAVRAKA